MSPTKQEIEWILKYIEWYDSPLGSKEELLQEFLEANENETKYERTKNEHKAISIEV